MDTTIVCMKPSESFEQKIFRLHTLLEPDGNLVTWNDKIFDPDNPERTRQIDISIRSGNKITHIECRLHEKKQDVKWIEELFGRKVSLNASRVIALSSSGFTKGALLKAKRLKISIRTLSSIDSNTVKKWKGDNITARLVFYTFLSFDIYFIFNITDKHKLNGQDIMVEAKRRGIINQILDVVNKSLDSVTIDNITFPYSHTLNKVGLSFFGAPIQKIFIQAIIKVNENSFHVPIIESYSDTNKLQQAVVETVQGFEVIKSSKGVSITFNPSTVDLLLNSLLRGLPIIGLGRLYTVKRNSIVQSEVKTLLPILKCYTTYVFEAPEYFLYTPPPTFARSDGSPHRGARRKNGNEESPGNA